MWRSATLDPAMETCKAERWVTYRGTADEARLSLFDRIGGFPRIEWLVDRFVDQIGSDPELALRWARFDPASMRTGLAAFFAEAFGARPAAPDVESHPLMQLDGEQFLRVALMLYDTIASMGLPEDLHAEVVLAVVDRALATHLTSSPTVV